MGTDELQAYVKGVMAAKRFGVSEVQRRTGISRPTLTAITKGRYSLGSERTRDTLERLADGLEVPRAEMLAAAGLSPEAPAAGPSTVPAEMVDRLRDVQRRFSEEIEQLVEEMRAAGKPVPEPPKPSGGRRTPRKQPPPDGPQRSLHKGNRDSSS